MGTTGGMVDGSPAPYDWRMKSVGDDWMGTPAAAAYVGLTLRTLYKLLDEGAIPAYKFGRVLRVRRCEVDDFIERCRIKPGSLSHLYPSTGQEDVEEGRSEDDEIDGDIDGQDRP